MNDAHTPENDALFADAETPTELLGQLAGAASVCWENVGAAGVFDSERATALVDAALERLITLGWGIPPEEGDDGGR